MERSFVRRRAAAIFGITAALSLPVLVSIGNEARNNDGVQSSLRGDCRKENRLGKLAYDYVEGLGHYEKKHFEINCALGGLRATITLAKGTPEKNCLRTFEAKYDPSTDILNAEYKDKTGPAINILELVSQEIDAAQC